MSLTARLNFLISGAVVLYALPVLAETAESTKPGLPQLDTSLFPEQLFWLAVTFTALYLLMAFVALPGVQRTQDNRHKTIASEIATAAAANEKAKAMMEHVEKALKEARAEAHVTVSSITALAAKESAEQKAQQQQILNRRLVEAEASIMATRDAVIRDMGNNAAELGYSLLEKITGMKVTVTPGGARP